MANTDSWAFPNIFDVSRNRVAIVDDNVSLVNRTRLLMLTEPTELYNNPTFGVGLKRYLWQYNTENTRALIKDRIVRQIREHEPCAIADETVFADDLVYTELEGNMENHPNVFTLTVGLKPTYGNIVNITIDNSDLQSILDYHSSEFSSVVD